MRESNSVVSTYTCKDASNVVFNRASYKASVGSQCGLVRVFWVSSANVFIMTCIKIFFQEEWYMYLRYLSRPLSRYLRSLVSNYPRLQIQDYSRRLLQVSVLFRLHVRVNICVSLACGHSTATVFIQALSNLNVSCPWSDKESC